MVPGKGVEDGSDTATTIADIQGDEGGEVDGEEAKGVAGVVKADGGGEGKRGEGGGEGGR